MFTYGNLARKNRARKLDEYLQHMIFDNWTRDQKESDIFRSWQSEVSGLPDPCSCCSLPRSHSMTFSLSHSHSYSRTHLRFYFLQESFPPHLPLWLGDALSCFGSTMSYTFTLPLITLYWKWPLSFPSRQRAYLARLIHRVSYGMRHTQ